MKNKIIKIVKIVFLVLVLIFISKFLYKNINELKSARFKIDAGVFTISLILFWIYKVYNAALWHYITVKAQCSISLQKAVVSWMYSLLGKFIPGKVFLLGGRLYFYDKEGVSKKKITFCFLLENLCILLAALFIFLLSLFFIDVEAFEKYKYASAGLLVLFFILINPYFLQKALNLPLKILKKEPVTIPVSYKDMLRIVLLFITNWLVLGLGFFLLVNSIYPISIGNYFYLSGAFALANIIGILSLFAPSGIGVREAILVLSLKAIIPLPLTIIISIVSRLWATLGELLIVLFAFIYAKIRKI